MAKTHTNDPEARRVRHLFHYHGRIEGGGGWRHEHPFWQLEYVRRGPVVVRLGAERLRLRAGDVVVVPPGVSHAFEYPTARHEFVSLKFEFAGSAPTEGGRRAGGEPRLAALGEYLWLECEAGAVAPARLEGVLEALLDLVLRPGGEDGMGSEDDLIARVKARVLARRGAVRVKELAGEFGMSAGNLRRCFSQDTGGGLKEHIDEVRARQAERMLTYEDRRVGEIAEALGFGDVFAFSRFFRRRTGRCPREFRRRAAEAGRGGGN